MMLDYEEHLRKQGYVLIAGTDEAGRGPLCGPLVVASCIMNPDYRNDEINDSKKLTEKKREKLYSEIIENALAYDIEIISPEEIDQLNIYEASRTGMVRALSKLKIKPDYILTDAMKLHQLEDIPQEALIKGDGKSFNIAASSILAKVTRDHIMLEYDKKYPQYQLAKHKGYPTALHLKLIEQYGVIPEFYRFSYKPVKNAKIAEISK